MSQVYKIEFKELVKGPAGEIQPGVYWISKGDMPNFLSAAKPGTWEILDMIAVFPDYWRKSKNKDIIIIRPGGFGDLLFLNPVRYGLMSEGYRVTVACLERFKEFYLKGEAVISYPIKSTPEIDDNIQYSIVCEGQIERNRGYAPEKLCEWVGIKKTAVNYYLEPDEIQFGKDLIKENCKLDKTITLHCTPSTNLRGWPVEYWGKLIETLSKDYNLLIIGAPGQVRFEQIKNVVNLTDGSGLTFRESASVINSSNLFIGIDSSQLNIAHALRVPAIGLYGPVVWQDRSAGDIGHNFNGKADCAPCNFHPFGFTEYPEGCSVPSLGYCRALSSITPEMVLTKVRKYLG